MPPVDRRGPYVLTINGGSSSLKFAVFAAADPLKRIFAGRVHEAEPGPDARMHCLIAGERLEHVK